MKLIPVTCFIIETYLLVAMLELHNQEIYHGVLFLNYVSTCHVILFFLNVRTVYPF